MTATAHESARDRGGLAPAYAAARTRLGLIALLLTLAAVGWWWTAREMQDMDGGPWTELGTVTWFLGVWIVMMAAMMFPSVAPTVALYSKLKHTRALGAPLLFASGYLLVWSAVGLLAYALARIGGQLFGDVLAWDSAGRWVAGATLLVAAAYELTPLTDVCLGKCRTPLGFLLGSWRDGLSGAMQMGARHGAWCVGCCWALMASLFALGVMSVVWMALVAGLIAFEKLIPSRGDVRNCGSTPRSRGAHARGSGCHPGAGDSGSRIDVADEPNEPLGIRSRSGQLDRDSSRDIPAHSRRRRTNRPAERPAGQAARRQHDERVAAAAARRTRYRLHHQAEATTSRTSTPSSVTSSGASAAIARTRSPAARAFSSESKTIIESPFVSPPPVAHVQ